METPSLIYTYSPTQFWVRKLVPAFKMCTCFAHMERRVYEWKRGRERWGNRAGRIWLGDFRKNAECNSEQKWGPMQTLIRGRTLCKSLDISALVFPSASALCKHQIPFLVWLKRWRIANPGAHLGICELILSRPASFRNTYLHSIKQTTNKQIENLTICTFPLSSHQGG